eukprot:g9086.t1
MTSLYEPLRNTADDTFGTFQGTEGSAEDDELHDEFEEENMVAKDREAIWSPPGNYLDQSPGHPGGENLGNISLGQTLTEEERQIKQERRKLRRRRSSNILHLAGQRWEYGVSSLAAGS